MKNLRKSTFVILLLALVAAISLYFSVNGSLGQTVAETNRESYDAPPVRELSDGPAVKEENERGEGEGLRQRAEARKQIFADAPDEVKLHALDELRRQQQLYPDQIAGAKPLKGIPQWQSIGPTQAKYQTNGITLDVSDSGRIRNILPHPMDPDIVYALTSGGGLWKTTTFTHTNPKWEPKTDGLISTSGGSVAFGRNPNTLYMGIGDPFDIRGLIAGVVVKSTDGGNTWSSFVSLPGASDVRDLKVDTSGPNDVVLVGTDIGMFRSADSGASYQQIAPGYGEAFENLRSVWSIVRTSAGWLASAQDDYFNVFSGFGQGFIFYSTDKGATWAPIPNGGNGYSDAGRTTLSVANPGESVVYGIAGDIDGQRQKDLFKSTDGGLNWTPLNITDQIPANAEPYFQPNMNILAEQAWYNQLILTDPQDPTRNTVYIGGQYATAKTTNGGASWALKSFWLPFDTNLPYLHADCHAAAFSKLGGRNTLFFGSDGGVFISTNGGDTWSDDKNDGINSMLAYSISSSEKTKQTPIIALQDTGVRVRVGSSTVYNQVEGGDGVGVGWSQANNSFTLLAYQYMGIERTDNLLPNTFGTWTPATTGIYGSDYYPFYTNILAPPASADPTGRIFYTHTGWRVYETVNGGASWFRIGDAGVTPGLRPKQIGIGNFRDAPNTMGVSPIDHDRVAIAEYAGRLAITTNGGQSWTEPNIVTLVPGYQGGNKSPAWANNTTLYLSSIWPFGGPIRVVKSTDGGATWTAKSSGLPDIPVNKVLVDPRDPSGNIVYAGTWFGVYRTTDGGNTWRLFGAGLPAVEVSDMYMPGDGSFLRISTYGRGVWEIKP